MLMSHLWKEQVSKINGTLVKYSYNANTPFEYNDLLRFKDWCTSFKRLQKSTFQ